MDAYDDTNGGKTTNIQRTLKQISVVDELQEIFGGDLETMIYSKRLLKLVLDLSNKMFFQSVDDLF